MQPELDPEETEIARSIGLLTLLEGLDYRVLTRRRVPWWEALIETGRERWRGLGATEDSALRDAVAQMFPSRAARELLVETLEQRQAAAAPPPPSEPEAPPAPANGTNGVHHGSNDAGILHAPAGEPELEPSLAATPSPTTSSSLETQLRARLSMEHVLLVCELADKEIGRKVAVLYNAGVVHCDPHHAANVRARLADIRKRKFLAVIQHAPEGAVGAGRFELACSSAEVPIALVRPNVLRVSNVVAALADVLGIPQRSGTQDAPPPARS